MKLRRRHAIWLEMAAILAFSAPAVRAQYMYLDANGDAVHDSTDRMNKIAPTTLDLWLDTDSNRNGSAATCSFGTGALDLSSYEVVLQAVGGSINWGPMTNLMANMAKNFARDARDTTGTVYYHNGWGGTTPAGIYPPGLYKLASLTATVATGSPRVDIVVRHVINRTARTSFGSDCIANAERDHTNKFSYNWFDADGVRSPIDAAPVVRGPELVLPQDGAQVVVDVTASDPDGDAITSLSADFSGLPPGHNAVFTPNGSNTAGNFTWTPTSNDSGNYLVTFTAMNFLPGARKTTIHVIGTTTGVESNAPPASIDLAQNRPNPFNPATVIEFTLPRYGHARLAIYDLAGRLVRELVNQELGAGPHSSRWLGEDLRGRPAASGIYCYRLEASGLRRERKMVLLR
jgi:hypothetical protein